MSGLDLTLRAGKLSHAYILTGPAGEEKRAAALRLAQTYVCTGDRPPCGTCPGCRKAQEGIHPDVIWVGEPEKDVSVSMVRQLRSDAYILPNEAPRKVYLIDRAETMNASAQNAMLKLLEDGPAYAAFLLLTDPEGALLPTVRSRCEVLRLDQLTGEAPDPELTAEAQRLAALLTAGEERALLEYGVTLEKWDRDKLSKLLDAAAEQLHAALPHSAAPKEQLKRITHLKTLSRALDFNVGPGHVAGWLCAALFS